MIWVEWGFANCWIEHSDVMARKVVGMIRDIGDA